MRSKKRKISAILGACSLFSSFGSLGYARETTESKQKILKIDSKTNNKLSKDARKLNNNMNLDKNADNSNFRLKVAIGLLGAASIVEGIYILKQRDDINDAKHNAEEQANQLKYATKEIKKSRKKIKNLISSSNAFAKVKAKYKFVEQLSNGSFGSTAIFEDSASKYVVVKTLFKSGGSNNLDGIQKERDAVEFLKTKPQNNHMVFPTEYFEDDNFLFVVYPFVPWQDGAIGRDGAYRLGCFKDLMNLIPGRFTGWDEKIKKQFIWNIAKQLFEIYKYFCENNFYHNDIRTNVLIQLNKKPNNGESLSFDDFTLKVIDWGDYYESSKKPEKNGEYPYEPMMSKFENTYCTDIRDCFLYSLYEKMKIPKTEHKKSNGEECEDEEQCCKIKFFSELDRKFGCQCYGFCKTLGGFFKKKRGGVTEDWVKDFPFAQNFDDLIKFCQDQIDKLK